MSHQACQPSIKGVKISGTIKGAEGKKINLDRMLAKSNETLSSQELDASGDFSFVIDDTTKSIYRLRVGGKSMLLCNEDGAKQIEVSADLTNSQLGVYQVEGSPASKEMQQLYGSILGAKVKQNDFKTLNNDAYPLSTAYLTYKYLPATSATLAIHQNALQKLQAAYPAHSISTDYADYFKQKANSTRQAAMNSSVRVGSKAPDIVLPNPDGEMMSLSSLEGKVVIVDFWASWCGPCRRYGNPELVKLYNKHKNEDFAIFNVALERGKSNQRWVDAIEKDGLVWPHQVVDRDREFSPIYGASRIPRTYVIDKAGNLAAINPHGAQLEKKVEELLRS